jgi:putative membrane protein
LTQINPVHRRRRLWIGMPRPVDIDRPVNDEYAMPAASFVGCRRHRYAYPVALLGVFLVVWLTLAIRPWYRQDWLLENVVVFAVLPLLTLTARRLRFSNGAYTLLFVFMCAHEIGAHYTYSMVPYEQWVRALTGGSIDASLGFQRNHYDRLVHFLFGLLLLPMAVELFDARAPARGVWKFLLPVLFIESLSAVFELIEWLAAMVFGGDLGQAYLGTQGDVWDAQRDMTLALVGATLAQLAVTLRRRYGAGPGNDRSR